MKKSKIDYIDEQELYICDLNSVQFKDMHQQMEHPFYCLSKRPDYQTREYNYGDKEIIIEPSKHGMPTIYDKDILVFCISLLMWRKRNNEPISPKVTFKASDYFAFTDRTDSGENYKSLLKSIKRLRGVEINTNIETGNIRHESVFGIINGGDLIYDKSEYTQNKKKLRSVYVELSDWVFNSIEANEVLTLNRDYFKLSKPLEKRLYEIFRKHCGKQEYFPISVKKLHYKSGSINDLRRFKYQIKSIANADTIPDYSFRVSEDDIVTVTYTKFDTKPKTDDLPTLSDDAIEKAKELLKDESVDKMIDAFYKRVKKEKKKIYSPDKAFLAFVNFRINFG